MDWRNLLTDIRLRALPIIVLIVAIAGCAVAVWLLPNRTAAALLGLFAAGLTNFSFLRHLAPVAQAAVLWFAVGVTADAAYAKLSDQVPVTVATALMKIVDATVKLGDTVVRSIVFLPADTRVKIGAVTPDFVWAFILGLILFMAFGRVNKR
ncbi:MAG: hypothetical protein SGJ17_14910 [Hyphomicrobiales bacterium]|nr:hypothetical protein [Hyphomicrobiales bacterium]